MKQLVTILFTVTMLLSASCSKFLEEDPAGFITPEKYYTTEDQVQAAVNGTYAGLDDVFSTGIGVAISPSFLLEYITGYSYRLRPSDHADNQFYQSRLSAYQQQNKQPQQRTEHCRDNRGDDSCG